MSFEKEQYKMQSSKKAFDFLKNSFASRIAYTTKDEKETKEQERQKDLQEITELFIDEKKNRILYQYKKTLLNLLDPDNTEVTNEPCLLNPEEILDSTDDLYWKNICYIINVSLVAIMKNAKQNPQSKHHCTIVVERYVPDIYLDFFEKLLKDELPEKSQISTRVYSDKKPVKLNASYDNNYKMITSFYTLVEFNYPKQ